MESKNISLKCTITATEETKAVNAVLFDNDYSVMPVVMMIEGAYYPSETGTGGRTALYFSGDELKKSIPSWNGRGVSLRHPHGVSTFNSPAVFDKQFLGFIFNARYDTGSKSLKAEMWLEKKRSEDVLNRIANNDKIDVSIGASGNIEEATGNSGGTKYSYTFSNIIGDHLAVLPDQEGACSWSDGCGIRASAYTSAGDVASPEEGVLQVVATANEEKKVMEEENKEVEMKVQKEPESGCVGAGCYDMHDYLAKAPGEFRQELIDAVEYTAECRKSIIGDILASNNSGLDIDFLKKTPTKNLKAINALVCSANEARVVAGKEVTSPSSNVDYGVNGVRASSGSREYMAIKKIQYN